MSATDGTGDSPGLHHVPVYGYPRLVQTLSRAAAGGRLGQAYLLAGPPAVGKRQLARRFAQTLLCPEVEDDGDACGACRSCRLVAEGGHPDLHLMDPPLKVGVARKLQATLALAPVEGRHRVVIVPEIELATANAANSLLKTLEEPPPQVVILLTTALEGGVLSTIRSRCQVLPMRALPSGRVAELLETHAAVDPERAQLLARLSGGRVGWALDAAQDPAMLESREQWLDGLDGLLRADRVTRFSRAAEWARKGAELRVGLAIWLAWWRDLLLLLHRLDAPVVNRDRQAALVAAADRYDIEETLGVMRALELALQRLQANTSAQLTLEVLFMEMPS